MKKLILISAIAIVALSSCGHDYMVRSIDTNNIVYMNDSRLGDDLKVGDTVRLQGQQRIDSVSVQKVTFIGVVVSSDKKD